MEINLFLRGLLIGFSIAAPVGPIAVLCIRRTLEYGRLSGFISGLGAATADAIYGSIAALGFTFLSRLLIDQQTWLRLIGGLFLCYLGGKTFFAKPVSNLTHPFPLPASERGMRKFALGVDYASTFFLTLTNPLTILSFAAIFAGIAIPGSSSFQALLLVLGVFCGSTLWWLILSHLADILRLHFLRPQETRWVNRLSGLVIAGFSLAVLISVVSGLADNQQPPPVQARLAAQAYPADPNGFSRAEGPRSFSFPADHGPHDDFQTEWWYYTGNLQTPDSRRFGYQLTFFRRALLPPDQTTRRASDWATSQVYMAHFTLTDISSQKYQAFERLSRGAAGLSGAQANPFQVWLDDWRVEQVTEYGMRSTQYHLVASQNDLILDLTLNDLKGPILQGDQGYSRKGGEPGQASYYYSLTRLDSRGSLQIGDQRFEVSGLSWMDHEFSTSALSQEQVGWDWFSVQLDDGTELMVFQLRRADGSLDPFSSGTLISPDGSTTPLSQEDFHIQVESSWKSPHSKATYPARWSVTVPRFDLTLNIAPYLADQELNLSFTYWEGAVHVQGTKDGQPISGYGYVELTGYSGSISGQF